MNDCFLKNNKEMNSENQTMRKAALAEQNSGIGELMRLLLLQNHVHHNVRKSAD